MLRITERNRNFWTTLLVFYCLIAIYYVGLITPNTSNQQKEKVPTKLDVTTPLKNHQPLQKKKIQNDQQMPSYASALGNFTHPKPGFRAGFRPKAKSKLIIGIPTVQRKGKSYLIMTLKSLLENMVPKRDDVRIVVSVGETNETYIEQQANLIAEKFEEELSGGILEIIAPPKDFYPDFDSTVNPSFGDKVDRVKWRSKQNLDQIFLMMYVYHLSPEYYLMLEDDVLAKKGYVEKILDQVEKTNDEWLYVSFCTLGAIGKLFRRHSLPSFATFIHMFWNRKPLDWLQLDYAKTLACSYDENEEQCHIRMGYYIPNHAFSLFQHMGRISSLRGKEQLLRDPMFSVGKKPKGLNKTL